MVFARIVLVLLLALLLPVRGAVAAAGMVCSGYGHTQAGAADARHHGQGAHEHAHAVGHESAQAADASGVHFESSAADVACSLCAACGSAASLPSSPAGLPSFAAPSGKAVPLACVARPSHVSDGLERPPRSI